jgi:hypothetical protein
MLQNVEFGRAFVTASQKTTVSGCFASKKLVLEKEANVANIVVYFI